MENIHFRRFWLQFMFTDLSLKSKLKSKDTTTGSHLSFLASEDPWIYEKIEQRTKTQRKSKRMTKRLYEHIDEIRDQFIQRNRRKSMSECGSYRVLAYFKETWKLKVAKGNYCKDRGCFACQTIKAIRQAQAFYSYADEKNLWETMDWYYVVLTIKHNELQSCEFVLEKLKSAIKKLNQKVRDDRKSGENKCFFSRFDGGIWTIENTVTNKWRNRHCNFLVWVPKWKEVWKIEHRSHRDKKTGETVYDYNKHWNKVFHIQELSDEWEKITGDSHVTSIEKVRWDTPEERRLSLMEVFKYSFKNTNLPPKHTLEYLKTSKGCQLCNSRGSIKDLKLAKVKTKDQDLKLDTAEYMKIIQRRNGEDFEIVRCESMNTKEIWELPPEMETIQARPETQTDRERQDQQEKMSDESIEDFMMSEYEDKMYWMGEMYMTKTPPSSDNTSNMVTPTLWDNTG